VTGSGRGVAGAVLVGGSSHRMGVDKAAFKVDGRPMVMAPIEALRGAGVSPVCVVGGHPMADMDADQEVIPDRWPGEGPLGGILTALNALDEEEQRPVMVLACDLPDASAATVREILERVAAAPDAVILPMLDGVPQWLHALWPAGARTPLTESFEAGERAPWRAGRRLPVIEVAVVDGWTLSDIDTPEDLVGRGISSGSAPCHD